MKKMLFLLSSCALLLVASNSISNKTETSFGVNKLVAPAINEQNTNLFNNKYGYLNNDDWIINQAESDNKFYSYDTSYANFKLSDSKTWARDVFMVTNNGELVYNPEIKVQEQDKYLLAEAKTRMVTNKKITSIIDDYNPYSKSYFNTSYFGGDNYDWKFLQWGGFEQSVDISSQHAANKIEHNTNLTETMALYYIAKAVRTEGGIDERVAYDLGTYFINHSSLKLKVSPTLMVKIIDEITNNDDIYNFITTLPIVWDSKNVALAYIFDNNNNLVALSLKNWDNHDFKRDVNINYADTFNGTSSTYEYLSPTKTVFGFWTDYANNWNDFVTIFPTFSFNDDAMMSIKSQYDHKSLGAMHDATENIKGSINGLFYLQIDHEGGFFGARVHLTGLIMVWHDDHNVYCAVRLVESSFNATQGCSMAVSLSTITFNNSMK